MFHPRCGRCVHLANGNKTAFRSNPTQEFNRGLIFSLEPIKDNEVFEVTIDKKVRQKESVFRRVPDLVYANIGYFSLLFWK